MIYLYTDTLDVRLVRKRNSKESEELPSAKRKRSSDDSEGMYCYYNKEHNFLDNDSDASIVESQDTDVNVLTDINKVKEGINIYKYCLFLMFYVKNNLV